MAATDFRAIADRLAADIAAGRLGPGERLPPQRDFAYRQGIAASTASRVYAELARRGLITGEVGRGSFVRAQRAAPGPALAEPTGARVDLELNFPILPLQSAALRPALEALLRPDALDRASLPVGAAATAEARAAAAAFLARGDWSPDPAALLFTGNGRQAIAATLSALAPVGARVGVEAITYPVVKAIAARLGIALVPLAMDGDGVRPDALAEAHRAAPLRAVYLQPTLHNPLGVTMPRARQAALADVLRVTDIIAVEDAIYSFLAGDAQPLAALAPERVVLVDSLSKRIAPGLTLGFIAPPLALRDHIAASVRSGVWSAAGFPLAAGLGWIADGTAARIATEKRGDAAERQKLARRLLDGLTLQGDPRAYHLWVELPEPWRAEAFAAAAARHGIAVAPAGAFAVVPGHAPSAVRLALASPPLDALTDALSTLRRLALAGPGETGVE
jgi:DNA-binding transcriptional MocR family regulator